MLASINPLGERARNTRWGRTVSWYLAGSLAGGVAVGAAAGGLGAALRLVAAPSALVVGLAALGAAAVGLALDLHLHPVPCTRPGGLHELPGRRGRDLDGLRGHRHVGERDLSGRRYLPPSSWPVG